MLSVRKVSQSLRFNTRSITEVSARVISNVQDAIGHKSIEVMVPDEIAKQYTIGGQYVQIQRQKEKPGFYAMASAPGENIFRFLIKESPCNQVLNDAPVGSEMIISAPLGQGFQCEKYFDKFRLEHPVKEVIMMGCGTGLAPLSAVINSNILKLGKDRTARLYIGVNTLGHLPMRDSYAYWSNLGVKVIPVIYYPPVGWAGDTGFVQDDLAKDRIPFPQETGIMICGRNEMIESTKRYALDCGVMAERILLNY